MSAVPIFPHTITPWQSMPDKDAVIAHYAAEEAKAAEEAQQAKDAALWRKVIAMEMFDLYELTDEVGSMDEFIKAISEQ